MKIKFSKKFGKQYDKAPKKVRIAFQKRLTIFRKNIYSYLLNNHALVGRFKGYRSINVTGDWRAIYRELNKGKLALFDALGTHSQLYR